MGTPGPNPGGPGLTPYSSGPRTTAAPPPSAPPGDGSLGDAAVFDVRYQLGDAAKAPGLTPGLAPRQDGRRIITRGFTQLTGGTANQLNQEELQRLQAGNFSNPSAPSSAPGMMPPGQPGGARMTTHGTVQ